MSPNADDHKSLWRAWATTLPPQESCSRDIVAGLRTHLHTLGLSGLVLTFRPMPGEIDLEPLLVEFRCAVTRTWPHGRLTVHSLDCDMEEHRWGFLQPVADAPTVPASAVEVVVVPGLLFDRFGSRLGRGAGYYDRFLSQLAPHVPLIGITTSDRVVDQLPMEEHDITMTHLATEHGVHPVD